MTYSTEILLDHLDGQIGLDEHARDQRQAEGDMDSAEDYEHGLEIWQAIRAIVAEHDKMTALFWAAAYELNSIHARYGALDSVFGVYFSNLVEAMREVLGGDIKPWPEDYMKPHLTALAAAKGESDG